MFSVLAKKKVSDVMTRGVVTVKFYEPLSEVLKQMVRENISAVVVVSDDGEAMGIVSAYDIMRDLKDKSQAEFKSMVAEDVMTPFTISITPDRTLQEAAEIMVEKRIHRLPVLHSVEYKGRVPVGIISATDIVRVLTEEMTR